MSNTDRNTSSLERPIPGSYDERLAEARRLRNHGAYDEALAILERISARLLRLPERRRAPGSELWVNLIAATALMADIKATTGHVDEAESLWAQLEEWDRRRWTSWRRLRLIRQIERGEVDEGIRQLHELAEENPDDIHNWLAAAEAAMEAGRYDSTEAWLQRARPLYAAVEDDELAASYVLLRYRLNSQLGRWREALDDWYGAMELSEELEQFAEMTVRELLAAEQYDLALELLTDEVFLPPVVQYYQAWIARHRGDQVRARHLWRQLIETEQDAYEALNLVQLKALSLCWLGRPAEAVAMILQEVELTGELQSIDALALALGWGMMGKATEARANLSSAVGRADVQPLSALEWYDFDTLIRDEALKTELRKYFVLND
ncbi:MAG: tetratricopeptide repeat protein [Anaerolineae bacterium]|nr:tetratricopeptide repeat protein [Anaerolineae bacterium]